MEPVSGTVNDTVTIGSAGYPSPLDVTSTGKIQPLTAVDGVNGAGTLTNEGEIYGGQNSSGTGAGGIGVDLTSATVTNSYSIEGGKGFSGSDGGEGVSVAGTLTNHSDAAITGGNSYSGGDGGVGVSIAGNLTNDSSATIAGGYAYSGSGTGGVGVIFSDGTLMNDAMARIEGGGIGFGLGATGNGGDGLHLGANAVVQNYGNISGTGGPSLGTETHPAFGGTGVTMSSATDIFTNYGGGSVNGGNGYTTAGDGIDASGSATVINDVKGSIGGGVGDGSGDSGVGVQVSGGASLTNDGTVQGGTANEIGTGGDGVKIIGSKSTVDNESKIYGGTGFGGDGVGVYLNGGTLGNDGAVYGGSGSVFGRTGDSVQFGSAGGTLKVETHASFHGDIGGFSTNGTIDITNLAYYSTARTDLTQDAGGYSLKTPSEGTLQIDGTFTNEHFHFAPDAGSGTDVTLVANTACYRRGTRIRTARGEVTIESLRIGDRVLTLSGEARPLRWIGHRGIECKRYSNPQSVWPVRIQAGALDEQLPARDLWVSPGHALMLEGVLIQAEKLVNGASITQVECDQIEYWHVELESHDVLIAEGAPAESYLDTGNRTAFINGGAFLEAYPDFRPKHWSDTCVPLVTEGEILERARARVHSRAEALGYVITDDTEAHVLADGERIDPIWLGERRLGFVIPTGASRLELVSRTFVPAHTRPESSDGRALGLCVNRVQIDGSDVALDDAHLFADGWHGLECFAGGQQRWSTERAPLPRGTRLLVVDLGGRSYLWAQSPVKPVTAAAAG